MSSAPVTGRSRRQFCLTAAGLALGAISAQASGRNRDRAIVYPRAESAHDRRVIYPLRLLGLALEKVGGSPSLHPSSRFRPQGRALLDLEQGEELDVVWSMTSIERERRLRPIRVPIDKGLIGWRLPLIRPQDAARFAKITTLADLRMLTAGQGHDWPDTEILRTNGITVVTGPSYENLFSMLLAERFDWFPRSIIEVWPEVETHSPLIVESTLALNYPGAFYYFVKRDNEELADRIELGLERALHDGSYDELFHHHFGPAIERSELRSRRIITLKNPLLSPQTPLRRKELWFSGPQQT